MDQLLQSDLDADTITALWSLLRIPLDATAMFIEPLGTGLDLFDALNGDPFAMLALGLPVVTGAGLRLFGGGRWVDEALGLSFIRNADGVLEARAGMNNLPASSENTEIIMFGNDPGLEVIVTETSIIYRNIDTQEVLREALIQPNTINTESLHLPTEWQNLDRLDDPINDAYINPDIWLETREGQQFIQNGIEGVASRGSNRFTVLSSRDLTEVSYWGLNEMSLRLAGREVSEVITDGRIALNVGSASGNSVEVPSLSNSSAAIHTHPVASWFAHIPSNQDFEALISIGDEINDYHTIVPSGMNQVTHFWLDENGNAMFSIEILDFGLR